MLANYLVVAAGGALGATIRYGIGQILAARPGQFPWPTLLANLIGCLVIGVLLGYGLNREMERFWLERFWLFAGVGVLGAMTTFSSFSGETLQLMIDKSWWLGFANIAANLLGSLAACAVGFGITKM